MSKNKAKKIAGRSRKDAREEQQAKKVVNTILGVLIALAVVILLYAVFGM